MAGAALVLRVIVPRIAGATPYVVLTDSMEPTYPVGTLVVARPVDPEQIRTGSVITYQLRSGSPELVTHRVVGIGTTVSGERTYQTQGDANEVPDVDPVRDVQVRGAAWYRVPYLGHVAAAFTGQREVLAVGAAVLLLGYAGWQVVGAVRERGARRRADARAPAGADEADGAERVEAEHAGTAQTDPGTAHRGPQRTGEERR